MRKNDSLIYFPGLNALRFIAAAAVIFFHTEHRKFIFQQSNLFSKWPFLEHIGELGVTFFFVISGFLITYLLLAERKQTGTISIRSFYIRRVLRIWPLYYLIVFLSFFVLCNIHFFDLPYITTEDVHTNFIKKLLLFLVFLPNVAFIIFGHVAFAKQSWSVGVEEQFYITWPWIVRFAKTYRQMIFALCLVLLIFVGGRYAIILVRKSFINTALYGGINFIERFLSFLRFGCMAIGAIGACFLFYEKKKWLAVIYNPCTQLLVYVILIALFAAGIKNGIVNDEVYSCLFIVIILNVCSNEKSFLKLRYKGLDFLGKISYGLYMYHDILVIFMIKLFIKSGWGFNEIWGNLLLYAGIVAGTVLVSHLSYKYFEKPFLRYKMKFTKIQSGNEGKEQLR